MRANNFQGLIVPAESFVFCHIIIIFGLKVFNKFLQPNPRTQNHRLGYIGLINVVKDVFCIVTREFLNICLQTLSIVDNAQKPTKNTRKTYCREAIPADGV